MHDGTGGGRSVITDGDRIDFVIICIEQDIQEALVIRKGHGDIFDAVQFRGHRLPDH